MSLKKLPTGHTAIPLEGEHGARNQRFRGVKRMVQLDPGSWILPDTFPYFADSFYNFKVYPDDVIVMGFPKTGTTWLQEIVWTMRNNPDLDNPAAQEPVYARSFLIEGDLITSPNHVALIQKSLKASSGEGPAVTEDQEEEEPPNGENQEDLHVSSFLPPEGLVLPLVKMSPRPRTLKTHLSFPLHNPQLLDTAKVIYIVRNPKDLLISYYHNSKLMTQWDFTGSFDEIIDVFINDEDFYGPYWSHVKEALSRKSHPNLHVVQYERLKKDPMDSLASLDRFLQTGCSEAQLRKICDYVAFDKMKSRQNPFPINIFRDDVVKKDGGFFRKGQVGDWKDKLTPEQEAKVDAWIQKNTKDLDLVFEYA